MLRKIASSLPAIALALLILIISFLRSAKIDHAFTGSVNQTPATAEPKIDYNLPYPGSVLPDSPLWPVKALRDKLWLLVTTSDTKKAELLLLLADKRLASSKILFQKGKAGIAFSTFTKAEKYLQLSANQIERGWKKGADEKSLTYKIVLAALKHREVADELVAIAPEDARAGIIKDMAYSQDIYIKCRDLLTSHGFSAPENPFNKE